jgi:hypothetical protein
MGRGARVQTGLAFVLSWVVYSTSLPFTGLDQAWVIPTALSILREGNTDLNEFVRPHPPAVFYNLECVPPQGPAVRYRPEREECQGGRVYNFFPVGPSVLALPFVWLMEHATRWAGPVFLTAYPRLPQPVAAFLAGDLVGGRLLAEMWIAAFFGACAVALFFATARRLTNVRAAWWFTVLFAFGTSMWSVATRSLWQHGPSALFLLLAVYCLVRGRSEPHWIPPAGLAVAAAYAVRPTNSLAVLALTIYVFVHHRPRFGRYLAWASPVAAAFVWYHVATRSHILPLYYRSGLEWSGVGGWLLGLAEQTVSPSRGLFVFTPVFLISVAGLVLAWRRRWLFPLTPYLTVVMALHAAVVAMWWPGHCYGSRYFADLNPWLALYLIPAEQVWEESRGLRRQAWLGLFVVLALWSVFVHARGAYSVPAQMWNLSPVDVIEQRDRVWDWRDPQFLRGL